MYDAAIKSCDSVLNIQADNVKALFRKGKCLAARGDTLDAIFCMKKGLVLDPESKVRFVLILVLMTLNSLAEFTRMSVMF